ncbi:putative non-LTR retroelement reverse transcriptase, partial [Tanacetum coccineum]
MIGVNSMVSKKVDGVKGKDGKETVSKEREVAKESKGADGSWSAVVQSNPKMKKYEYTIRDVDGVPTIRVPKEVIEKSTPLWEDMLVGKFQSTAPYVGKIHVLVNKIWPLGDKKVKIDVVIVDKTTVKFRIKDEWSPIEEDAQPEVKTMPVWVIVKNVPRYMYAWEGFAFMTSPIGEPIRLHPETEMCKNFEEGRVFVEVDLTKPLPTQYNFDTE